MPIQYCTYCSKLIDLDLEVEHFDDHMRNETDNGEDQSEGFAVIHAGFQGAERFQVVHQNAGRLPRWS